MVSLSLGGSMVVPSGVPTAKFVTLRRGRQIRGDCVATTGFVTPRRSLRELWREIAPSSECPERKIPQHQLLVAAALAQAAQCGVDEGLELLVVAVHRDGDAVTEVLGLAERPALELAAGLGRRAVEPERQADAVVEQEVDGARDERVAGELRCVEGA